jgi:ribosomal protein L37E
VCAITVTSRDPYRAEKKDCGSCGCLDSRNANSHDWVQLSDRRLCRKCGHTTG